MLMSQQSLFRGSDYRVTARPWHVAICQYANMRRGSMEKDILEQPSIELEEDVVAPW